jgi:phosphate-selective porin OprO/OprP
MTTKNKVKYILIFAVLSIANVNFAQDSTRVIPDGTQGETMKVGKVDSVLTLGNWYEFDGPLSSLKLGGGLLYEYAAYIQDDVSKEQIEMEPAFKVRDFRITMSGRVKVERFVTWKLGIMYDAQTSSWFMRETGIMVGLPEISGYVFVGRTKEGISLNKVMNGYAGWAMERQMALDVFPILADGIKFMSFLPKHRLFLNIGVFNDWISKNQSFSTYSWQFAVRAGWLAMYSESNNNPIIHIGVNYRYGEPEDRKIRLRSRPEANPAPYFIDTDVFPSHHSNHFGGELYFSSGPFMIGSEYYLHQFSSPETNNPQFRGGELVAMYILTGESRPYSIISNIYAFVPVNEPVFEGGLGAWEIVLRYSTLDLNGGTITGGKFWRITPMINWYLSENVRLELAYGYGVLNRFNLEGVTQFFQSRIQFML